MSVGHGSDAMPETVPFSWEYCGWSILIGVLSSISLPLGSLLGLQWQPASVITGIMESFGGGALLAALSVTMVAPISLSASDQSLDPETRADYKSLLIVIVISSIVGGVFFILLDELITRKGGELRKLYGQVRYYGVTPGIATEVEAKKMRTVQSSTIFRVLAPSRQKELARLLKPIHFHENDVLFCKGDTVERLYFIRQGNVELQSEPGQAYWVGDPGDVLGLMPIVTSSASQLTGIASTDVECLFVPADWLRQAMDEEPMLKYLMLKSMYAQNTVFMEVDEKLHENRRFALRQMSDRFRAEMVASEEAAFADHPGGVPEDLKEPADSAAAEARRLRRLSTNFHLQQHTRQQQQPPLDSSGHDEPVKGGKGRQQVVFGENIDTLIDMAIDGEMKPEDPHQVIREQLDNILFGDFSDDDAAGEEPKMSSLPPRRWSILSGGSAISNPAPEWPMRRSLTLARRSVGFGGPSELGSSTKSTAPVNLEEAKAHWRRQQRVLENNGSSTELLQMEKEMSSENREEGNASSNAVVAPPSPLPLAALQTEAGITGITGATGSTLAALNETHPHRFGRSDSDGGSSSVEGMPKPRPSTVSLAGIDVSPLTGPLVTEWHASGNTKGTAPLAVFLGILLDGIPESIVIGVHTNNMIRTLTASDSPIALVAVVPYTLIAGLFLSNFPEALASSMHMYKYGWSKLRILMMWNSIMVMTALGSGLGYALGNLLSEPVLVGVQGFAAGAMLTMIASSMIPESVHLCGPSWSGISVLWGFMATNLFQLIGG